MLLVDPAVSRAKFDRELSTYRKLEEIHQRKGWWILNADFPDVFAVFAAPTLPVPMAVFGALINFDNYDLWPPSVRLVHPLTREPYTMQQLPTRFPRREPMALPDGTPGDGPRWTLRELMQAYGADDIPFLCLPGIREYHRNPGHTGDPWLLRRGRGEGELYWVMEKLARFGLEPVRGLNIQLGLHFELPE